MLTEGDLGELFTEQPEILMMEEHANALIGVTRQGGAQIFVYDRDQILANLAGELPAGSGQDPWEAAEEWISYNIEGAYVGPCTPLICERLTDAALLYLAAGSWRR